MQTNINKTQIAGNLVRDLEATPYGTEGGVRTNGTIAVNNGKEKDPTYLDFTAFGKTAELLVKYAAKGDNVMVEGRLNVRKYETKDGQKRTSTEIIVNTFNVLSKKGAAAPAAAAAAVAEETL